MRSGARGEAEALAEAAPRAQRSTAGAAAVPPTFCCVKPLQSSSRKHFPSTALLQRSFPILNSWLAPFLILQKNQHFTPKDTRGNRCLLLYKCHFRPFRSAQAGAVCTACTPTVRRHTRFPCGAYFGRALFGGRHITADGVPRISEAESPPSNDPKIHPEIEEPRPQ